MEEGVVSGVGMTWTQMMMMSFICSCRNKKEEQRSIYTLRKVRTITPRVDVVDGQTLESWGRSCVNANL